MAVFRNYFLLDDDLAADRAVTARRQTGFGAGRFNRRICYFGVTVYTYYNAIDDVDRLTGLILDRSGELLLAHVDSVVAEVVVVSLDLLNALQELAIGVVLISAFNVFSLDPSLDGRVDHAAFFIEGVRSGRQVAVRGMAIVFTNGNRTIALYIVIVIADSSETIGGILTIDITVDLAVVLLDDTLQRFTIRTEGIGAGGQIAVRLPAM